MTTDPTPPMFVSTLPVDGIVRLIGYSTDVSLGQVGLMPIGVLPVPEDQIAGLVFMLVEALSEDELDELRDML